ncbi:MAG: universal stress protein [Cytophagales bacterium]|nr:universal stress protein [Cytophagales bacterium]
MKIIVGVDFSKSSDNAIDFIKNWAKKYIAEVELVHAYMPPMVDPSIPVGMIESNSVEIIEEYNKVLEKKVRNLRESGISASYRVVVGDLLHGIIGKDHSTSADLVVLGKTEKPDFIDRLIGSTSQHLVNEINIPLLIVPENYSKRETKAIAYATQLEFEETDVVKKVKELSDRLKATMTFVKIKTPDDLDINSDDRLLEKIKSIPGLEKTHVVTLEANSLKSGLKDFTDLNDSDLLVLVSHKRGLLDSILAPSQSKKLISKLDIPILIHHFA